MYGKSTTRMEPLKERNVLGVEVFWPNTKTAKAAANASTPNTDNPHMVPHLISILSAEKLKLHQKIFNCYYLITTYEF